jgi:hypothetical protein
MCTTYNNSRHTRCCSRLHFVYITLLRYMIYNIILCPAFPVFFRLLIRGHIKMFGIYYIRVLTLGRTITQAVSRWPLIAEARIQSQANPYEICGGHITCGQVFFRVLQSSRASIMPPMFHNY